MSKPLVQFSILAMIFFGTWFLLSRIDFITFFKVEELTRDNEQKLGALILDTVKKGHPELESDSVRFKFRVPFFHRIENECTELLLVVAGEFLNLEECDEIDSAEQKPCPEKDHCEDAELDERFRHAIPSPVRQSEGRKTTTRHASPSVSALLSRWLRQIQRD